MGLVDGGLGIYIYIYTRVLRRSLGDDEWSWVRTVCAASEEEEHGFRLYLGCRLVSGRQEALEKLRRNIGERRVAE